MAKRSDLILIDGVNERDLQFYRYPDVNSVEALGLKGIYLDNYFPWNGISNAVISQSLGFEVSPKNILGSIANYENLDNYVHGIHDYLKYLKFGFSRATDVASNLIRRGLLTRQDAAHIVSHHDGIFPCSYLDKSLESILANIIFLWMNFCRFAMIIPIMIYLSRMQMVTLPDVKMAPQSY